MKDLNGVRVTFTKADLAHLNDGQLKIIGVFPHILNRLKMLESQVYAHMNVALDESLENAKREVAVCAFVESVILIAGELKEGWEAFQQCYYQTKVSLAMNGALPAEIQTRLKRLSGHFTGTSLATFLRNNFAYHNSPGTIVETMKLLENDDTMAFYILAEDNHYFDYTTKIRIAAIAERLRVSDWTQVVTPLLQEIMGKVFNDVYLSMSVILRDILTTVAHERSSIEVKGVPSDQELRSEVFFHMQ